MARQTSTVVLLAFLLAASPAAAEAPPFPAFTDVTAAMGIPSLPFGEGAAWCRVDMDTRPDLLLPVARGANRLFMAGGTGLAAASGEPLGSGGMCLLCIDLDGDGAADSLVTKENQPGDKLLVFLGDATGTFTAVPAAPAGLDTGRNALGAAAGDFDGDGLPDLAVATWDRGALYRNLSAPRQPRFQEVPLPGGGEGQKAWGVVLADFDDDGLLDLLVTRGGPDRRGRPVVARGAGDGTFREMPQPSFEAVSWSLGAAAADLDGDGDLDFVLTDFAGPDRLFLNEGGWRFRDATTASGLTTSRSMGVAAGDLDGDLRPELVLAGYAGPVRLFRNRGAGRFEEVIAAAGWGGPGRNAAVALADMDQDGDLDLYLANVDGHNRLYRNESPPAPFLRVRPLVRGVPAPGTAIRVWKRGGLGNPAALLARLDILGGQGFCSQSPLEGVVRLPDGQPVDLLVTFPGGRTAMPMAVGPGNLNVAPTRHPNHP